MKKHKKAKKHHKHIKKHHKSTKKQHKHVKKNLKKSKKHKNKTRKLSKQKQFNMIEDGLADIFHNDIIIKKILKGNKHKKSKSYDLI